MNTTTERRRSAVPAWMVMLLVAILVALAGIALYKMNEPQPVYADPLTSVRNIGSLSGAPGDVVLVRDNGVYVLVRPGSTIWGIRAVRIDRGHCVRIDGAAARCAIDRAAYNVSLSIGAHTVERTR